MSDGGSILNGESFAWRVPQAMTGFAARHRTDAHKAKLIALETAIRPGTLQKLLAFRNGFRPAATGFEIGRSN